MYENMIIGTLIGAVGGICVARGWWLRRTRTRQQARCVVMEEVVLPEVTSWQVLSERLTLSMLTRAVPPMVRLQATQPFFLLDRRQVHRLLDVLSSADDHLRQLFIATNLPVDQTNDTTEGSLGKKVHFVKRPVSLQHPAILSLVDALTVELTQAELMIFMVRVFSHSCSIENEDADGFYAEEPSGDGLRHLMPSHKPDRQGPALCGSLPKPERSERNDKNSYPFGAVQGPTR